MHRVWLPFILSLFFYTLNLHAVETRPTFGHNLTPTTETVPGGTTTIGNYLIGHGITDTLMIASSPWLYVAYNSLNFCTRWTFLEFPQSHIKLSLDGIYIKTEEFFLNRFRQHSTFFRLTASKEFSSVYNLNLSFGYQYFFNSKSPNSLRPPPMTGTRTTLNLGALHQFKISPKWGVFLETAFLGLNYPNRYFHTGASGYYSWTQGIVQLGLTRSIPFGLEQLSDDDEAALAIDSSDPQRSIYFKTRAPYHAEIKVQLFFD